MIFQGLSQTECCNSVICDRLEIGGSFDG
jgi:hypothetical protein